MLQPGMSAKYLAVSAGIQNTQILHKTDLPITELKAHSKKKKSLLMALFFKVDDFFLQDPLCSVSL